MVDRWMLSRLQEHIKTATEAMDRLMVRRAAHSALYMLDQDFQWYLRRVAEEKETSERKGAVAKVFNEVLDAEVRMLAPITPHICEEVWEMMGRRGFISLASWPTYDEARVDVEAEENEALIKSVLEDTLNIVKATGITPKRINYYVAAPWKWKVYLEALERSISARITLSDLMKELMKDPDLKKIAEVVMKFTRQIVDEVNQMPNDKRGRQLKTGVVDESQTLREAESFFERELNVEVFTYQEEDPQRHDPKKRAGLARPYRPAIYVE